jgi:phosphoserine phosphatase RsbU/P
MNAETQIESLADVQRLLLPDNPRIRGLEYAIHYQPADIAAGDYYDLMSLTHHAPEGYARDVLPDMWGMMLGDVSGHGPAAAMEAVQFDAILRTYRGDEEPFGPAGALTYANRYFFSRRPRRHFMTVFAALSRPDARELDYVSAGHPPALLRRGDQVLRLGEDGDIPLGVDRERRYANSTCAFLPGDLLVVYSDGLPEASGVEREHFGFTRIEQLLRDAPPEPRAVLDALLLALAAHQRGPIGHDDQTILVLKQTA